jgi:hypothetical protein
MLKKLLSGEMALANPIPGVRMAKSSTGPLPRILHEKALKHRVGPLMLELGIPGVCFFGRLLVKRYNLPAIIRELIPGIEVYVAAHPRSWAVGESPLRPDQRPANAASQ